MSFCTLGIKGSSICTLSEWCPDRHFIETESHTCSRVGNSSVIRNSLVKDPILTGLFHRRSSVPPKSNERVCTLRLMFFYLLRITTQVIITHTFVNVKILIRSKTWLLI